MVGEVLGVAAAVAVAAGRLDAGVSVSISGCEEMGGFMVVIARTEGIGDGRGSRELLKNVVAEAKGAGSEELVAMIGGEANIAEVEDVGVISPDVRIRGPEPLSE